MKILILEGIPTSGKSVVSKLIAKKLSSQKVCVVDEIETHEPIMAQREQLHLEFFDNLLKKYTSKSVDFLIFDRLHMTQAFRAKVDVESYKSFEGKLSRYNAQVAYLQVAEGSIADRIAQSVKIEHEYLEQKGDSIHEIAQTYTEQQRYQLELVKTSILPFKTFDSTDRDFESITDQIIQWKENS